MEMYSIKSGMKSEYKVTCTRISRNTKSFTCKHGKGETTPTFSQN